jgi:hypothetical protein
MLSTIRWSPALLIALTFRTVSSEVPAALAILQSVEFCLFSWREIYGQEFLSFYL